MGSANVIDTDAIVVGGGFGGCLSLHRLRNMGLKTTLLEAGAGFGGVWYWNRYPGARVDSEMPTYQFNIHDVWKGFNWSERFPGHEELRRYFDHLDRVLDLSKDAVFNAIVKGVEFNSETGRWTCWTKDGLRATCKYLVMATGSSYKKHYPSFSGLESFKGRLVHSADYPSDMDVRGKRVGVVGNGASGIQIIQELAKKDCQLTVFARTPCIALPMKQRQISRDESEASKGFYECIFEKCDQTSTGFAVEPKSKSILQTSAQEKDDVFAELWSRGGFNFLTANYSDLLVSEEANAIFYDYWVRQVRARMTDPVKMDLVAPLKQTVFIGTKRPSLEQDYYEMIDRPHVRLHDLKKSPILEVKSDGIVTGHDGQTQLHEVDVLIFATGYDAVTGSLLDMGIRGQNGMTLEDRWKNGILTHLGTTIPDMPNLFMVYGPQAPTSLANGPPFIEKNVDWICKVIAKMRDEGLDTVQPTVDAASQWRDQVVAISEHTLFPRSNSWYMGVNIPGKRREPLIYMAGVQRWWQQCLGALEQWSGLKPGSILID